MSGISDIEINLNEEFPILSKAPIIEAVVEVLCRPSTLIEETTLKKYIEEKLPDYPTREAQRQLEVGFQLFPSSQSKQILNWVGHSCRSKDELQIVQLNNNGLRFSRLNPYENWNKFSTEVLRLWKIYQDVAKPLEIQRLGLRFINKILLPVKDLDLDEYLTAPPKSGEGLKLPFSGFLHTDNLSIPGHPFGIQIIQTIMPPQHSNDNAGLVLDIDAFTAQPFTTDDEVLTKYLKQLRWLKNKLFFGAITEKTLELLK